MAVKRCGKNATLSRWERHDVAKIATFLSTGQSLQCLADNRALLCAQTALSSAVNLTRSPSTEGEGPDSGIATHSHA